MSALHSPALPTEIGLCIIVAVVVLLIVIIVIFVSLPYLPCLWPFWSCNHRCARWELNNSHILMYFAVRPIRDDERCAVLVRPRGLRIPRHMSESGDKLANGEKFMGIKWKMNLFTNINVIRIGTQQKGHF